MAIPASEPNEDLRKKIQAGWERLDHAANAQKSFNFIYNHSSGGDKPVYVVQGKASMDPQHRLFWTDTLVFSSAPWYGFLIRKQQQGDSWLLMNTFKSEELNDIKFEEPWTHPIGPRAVLFRLCNCFSSSKLSSIHIKRPFSIDSSEVRNDNTIKVEAHFVDAQAKPTGGKMSMILDISADYSPLEIISTNTIQPHLVIEERRTLLNHSPLHVTEYAYNVIDKSNDFQSIKTLIKADHYNSDSPDQDKLRLSYYDLPDPLGVKPPPTTKLENYWYLVIGAALFSFLAFAFYRLKQRSTNRSTT